MISDCANGSRANDVAVFIIMGAAVIEIRVKAKLRGVALPKKILAIQIRDDHFLVAIVEGVQFGIGVLLAHVEAGDIVLKTIIIPIPKNAAAEIDVIKNKTAKIRIESLVTAAYRHKIIIVRKIAQMQFAKRLL